MNEIESIVSNLASFLWGLPLLFVLIGGGLFLLIYSRLIQFKYFNQNVSQNFNFYGITSYHFHASYKTNFSKTTTVWKRWLSGLC